MSRMLPTTVPTTAPAIVFANDFDVRFVPGAPLATMVSWGTGSWPPQVPIRIYRRARPRPIRSPVKMDHSYRLLPKRRATVRQSMMKAPPVFPPPQFHPIHISRLHPIISHNSKLQHQSQTQTRLLTSDQTHHPRRLHPLLPVQPRHPPRISQAV
jgi:hypothetical protein